MKFKLNETKTAKLFQKLSAGEYKCAIISAYVSDDKTTDADNEKHMLKLKADVRDKGLGYTEFISRWVKDGIAFNERSLLIGNIDKNTAMQLGVDYNQYSIIYKDVNGCFEICTIPFDKYNSGDIIRTFNISGEKPLNIEDAKLIFSRRLGGAASMPVKGSKRPFTLKEVEDYTLEEVLQPKPSTFQTEYSYDRII